ncbi:MAG TPA: N-acetylmuramoyl-L-alanine amidase [Methylomusa anaerophila]|uniref:N-acetylmuramoyl-L-alanine amidase LytC n=1 Tax=Methylomusa anaerophila TaxID=1930071 RepID=A0A348AHG3_9FIRM|nr:N-acetylmuramoyl-L-alanine amidase [Methylomusa anaerophila]BBB90511.1 N-acetylmuramoyl-L-alanine amidase LytC precursor [Methylomusa anaerophila]HML89849.1 N-acetylmuramoyl-L-alanine amidase [Methylomusa anaerophila]
MLSLVKIVPLVSLILMILIVMPSVVRAAAAESGPVASTYTVPEIKTFSLKQKDVVAIAVEECLPADAVANPLEYKLEPVFNADMMKNRLEVTLMNVTATGGELGTAGGKFIEAFNANYLKRVSIEKAAENRLKITADFPATAKPQITTVKRKRVSRPDNTTVYRTYLVLNFSPGSPAEPAKTIVLDAGHGGKDTGATNNYLYEKNLNLDIALLTRDILLARGYDVYMTRTDDRFINLLDRADAANILNAAVFISIHNNSMPEDMPDSARKLYRGTTVLYNSAAPQPAKDLATIMCDKLAGTLGTHQYPLQNRPGLVVLNSTWVPAVIAEVAMLPHAQDAKMISQRIYRREAAAAIAAATETYFRVCAAL